MIFQGVRDFSFDSQTWIVILERSDALRDMKVEGSPAWAEWNYFQGSVEENFATLLMRVSKRSVTQVVARTMIEQSTTMRLMSKALLGSNLDPTSLSM